MGEGDQVCPNEGPSPFTRGDNYGIAKIHERNKKSSSPEPITTTFSKILVVYISHKEVNGLFSSLIQHYDINLNCFLR